MALLAPEVLLLNAVAEVPKAQEPPVSQAMAMLPPPPSTAPLVPSHYASLDVLERALFEMAQLREDLQGANPRLVAGHLGLISGWVHSETSVRAEDELRGLRDELAKEARDR